MGVRVKKGPDGCPFLQGIPTAPSFAPSCLQTQMSPSCPKVPVMASVSFSLLNPSLFD